MRALPGSGCFVPLIGVRCLMLFLIFSYFHVDFILETDLPVDIFKVDLMLTVPYSRGAPRGGQQKGVSF